jgi:excisionase family DNA binding protein
MAEPNPKPRPKLRVRDVVEQHGLTERHVRQLVNERRIPFYKVGVVVMFDPDDLDAWFAQQRIEAQT